MDRRNTEIERRVDRRIKTGRNRWKGEKDRNKKDALQDIRRTK